jgi:hypothetical protein
MTPRLLFVCGFPSGGTDLVKTVLNAHPDVHLNGEMPFLHTLSRFGYRSDTVFSTIEEIEELRNIMRSLDEWDNLEGVDCDLREFFAEKKVLKFEDAVQKLFSSKDWTIWGNKTPQNTENIQALDKLFPASQFLIVVRDVRDVCLSWKKKWGKNMPLCAAKWSERMTDGLRAAKKLPSDRWLVIKFEDILLDTETTCRCICEFLKVPFSDRMLEHHRYVDRAVDGKINYGKAIKRSNTRKWERALTDRQIRTIEEIAYEGLMLVEYQPSLVSKTVPISRWARVWGKCADLMALVAVGNRVRSRNGLRERLDDLRYEVRKIRRGRR